MQDEFVATVSHELRTPMTSIAGSLALLVGGAAGPLPESALRLLTIAQKNTERLLRLIDDILDSEKIESGQVVLDLKCVDALALVQQAVEASRAYAERYGVEVKIAPTSDICEIRVDPDRFVQVITNLLSNAVKFSPPGAAVTVAVTSEREMVRISVRDRGPGIPAAFRGRIFERFAQADAGDRPKGGSGLGLSIVRQLVIRFGGQVGFEDASGGGTTFHVTLPRWRANTEATNRGWHASRPCVLICDGDIRAAHVTVQRLSAAGFATEIVATAEAAARRAVEAEFAGLVIHPQMPDLDGISLIQRLRKIGLHCTTPIVLCTGGFAHRDHGQHVAALDIVDWLEKPVDPARLAQVVGGAAMRSARTRPRILHVEEDAAVLGVVAQALDSVANVVSVDSIAATCRALQSHRFDLALVDPALCDGSGFDLLPKFCDDDGDPIPLIGFSEPATNAAFALRLQDVLQRWRATTDRLIAILGKSSARTLAVNKDKEVA
jgi:DNA-binding response OmpR family regulator/anti-sigma regulatory factor (Ser/Thr protein kinase)